MKKYIMGAVVISLLRMSQVGMAMKKEVKTSLSFSEVAELRQAVVNYKKNKSRSSQEKIISEYAKKYPNDPFVKSKLNEKARVDGTFVWQPKKQVTKPMQPMPEQPTPPAAPINDDRMKPAEMRKIANDIRYQKATQENIDRYIKESMKIIAMSLQSQKISLDEAKELKKIADRIKNQEATPAQMNDFIEKIKTMEDEE